MYDDIYGRHFAVIDNSTTNATTPITFHPEQGRYASICSACYHCTRIPASALSDFRCDCPIRIPLRTLLHEKGIILKRALRGKTRCAW